MSHMFTFLACAAVAAGGRVLLGRRKAPICRKWQVGTVNKASCRAYKISFISFTLYKVNIIIALGMICHFPYSHIVLVVLFSWCEGCTIGTILDHMTTFTCLKTDLLSISEVPLYT